MRDVAVYGDVGTLLGTHFYQAFSSEKFKLVQPTETIRATVIGGAGSQTVDVSGSTILVNDDVLPVKNIPVVLPFSGEVVIDEDVISREIKNSIANFYEDETIDAIAVAFQGLQHFSFKDITALARGLHAGCSRVTDAKLPMIIVLEQDIEGFRAEPQSAQRRIRHYMCGSDYRE